MAVRRTSAALEMLLLSVLADGNSLSGYQISAILAEPVSLMWAVKHSQIYPALSVLEEQGDIVGDWIVQNGLLRTNGGSHCKNQTQLPQPPNAIQLQPLACCEYQPFTNSIRGQDESFSRVRQNRSTGQMVFGVND